MAPRQRCLELSNLGSPNRQPSPVFSSDEEEDAVIFVYCLIEDPVTTFVREHIQSREVRVLVRYDSVEQDENVFSNISDGCTVQQLVDRLNLCLSPSARVRVCVVTHPQDNVNYVVDVTGNNREVNVRRDPIESPRNFDTESPASPDNSYDRGLEEEMAASIENPSNETVAASTSTDYPPEETSRVGPIPISICDLSKYSPTSLTSPTYEPRYSPGLPGYEQIFSPTSAQFSPPQMISISPSYSPVMLGNSPTSRQSSPSYMPRDLSESPEFWSTSPGYSPTSPEYSPTLPEYSASHNSEFSPTSAQSSSPRYLPSSPNYCPESPTSPQPSSSSVPRITCPSLPLNYLPIYSPTTPYYTPTTPSYMPASPVYKLQSSYSTPQSRLYTSSSPDYMPSSPDYNPSSPKYSVASSECSLSHDSGYSPTSPEYSLSYGPRYSPTSPEYSPMLPSYISTPISYTQTSTSYSPASPDDDKDREVDLARFYRPISPNYEPTFQSRAAESPNNSFDRGTSFVKKEVKTEIKSECDMQTEDDIFDEDSPLSPNDSYDRGEVKKEVAELRQPEVKTEIKSECEMLTEDIFDADSPVSPDNPYKKEDV